MHNWKGSCNRQKLHVKWLESLKVGSHLVLHLHSSHQAMAREMASFIITIITKQNVQQGVWLLDQLQLS